MYRFLLKKDRINWGYSNTGSTEAIQTSKLNGIPIAIGIMNFKFIGVVWDV